MNGMPWKQRSLNQSRRTFRATLLPGFTLVELIVATTLLTIVMTAVYTTFNATIRTWRGAESNLHSYQDARTAMDVLTRELSCVIGGSQHLFEGEDDEFEFFAVAPPMNVEKGEDPHVLWIRYHYNRSGKTLVRQEAFVKQPLPLLRPGEEEVDEGRVSIGRKYKFVLSSNVRDFEVRYFWVPKVERKPDEPPQWVEPIVMEENERGWGLPQGIDVSLTVDDPHTDSGKTTFRSRIVFRCPTTLYDEKRIAGRQ